jgi:hypothetical protein
VLFHFAREAAGAIDAPAFPAPLISEDKTMHHSGAKRAAGMRGCAEAITLSCRKPRSGYPESISPSVIAARWIPGLRLPRKNSFSILSPWRIPE